MSFDTSLFDYDGGYYEFLPNNWLPGRLVPGGRFTWSQKAIDTAVNLDLKDSDVIIATYPKTGEFCFDIYKSFSQYNSEVWTLLCLNCRA